MLHRNRGRRAQTSSLELEVRGRAYSPASSSAGGEQFPLVYSTLQMTQTTSTAAAAAANHIVARRRYTGPQCAWPPWCSRMPKTGRTHG